MNAAELILAVGIDNVGIQFLDTCADDLRWDAKKGTVIKFGTDQRLTPDGLEKCGMIVWMPRDAVAEAQAKAKAAEPLDSTESGNNEGELLDMLKIAVGVISKSKTFWMGIDAAEALIAKVEGGAS